MVFSTNLDPASLVDDAFLRRVRYKLEVSRPDARQYRNIFQAECKRRGVPYDDAYEAHDRPFNACEPRDLLAQIEDVCAYRGEAPHLTTELLDRVVGNYFVRFA